MSKSYHMCVSVRGALNRSYRELRGLFRTDDGRRMTGREVKEHLMDELAKGHEVIPASKCDNFDYKGDGCRGHENADR